MVCRLLQVYLCVSKVAMLVTALIICSCSIAYAQNPASPPKPLSLSKIKGLVDAATIPDPTIEALIRERGIDFVPTEAFIAEIERKKRYPKTVAILTKKINERRTNEPAGAPRKTVKILVANFYSTTGQNRAVSETIKQQLEAATGDYPEIQIESSSEIIDAQKGSSFAKKLGEKEHADLVLWGWYTTSGTTAMVSVNFDPIGDVPYFDSLQQKRLVTKPIASFDNFSFQIEIAEEYSAVVLLTLGLIKEDQNEPDLAIKYYSEVLAIKNISKEILFYAYLQRGAVKYNVSRSRGIPNDGEGIKDIKMALDLNPNSFYANLSLGTIYLQSGPVDESIPLLNKAVESAPAHESKLRALLLLGVIYNKRGDREASDLAYKRAISEAASLDDQALRYLMLGTVALAKNDHKAAREALTECAKLTDKGYKTALAYFVLAASYGAEAEELDSDVKENEEIEKKLNDEALKYLKMASDLEPANSFYRYMLGEIYYDSEDYDTAIKFISEAIRLDPKESIYYIRRAQMYEEKKDFSSALSDFEKAIRVDYKSYLAHQSKASYHKNRKEYDKALKELDICQSMDNRAAVHYAKREIYDEIKDTENALKEVMQAIKIDPDYYEGYFFYGAQVVGGGSRHPTLEIIDKVLAAEESPYLRLVRAFDHLDRIKATENYFSDVNYTTAMADFDKAFTTVFADSDYRTPAHVYSICSEIVDELVVKRDTANGLKYSAKCIDYLLKTNGKGEQIGPMYNYQGVLFYLSNKFDTAVDNFTTAIKYSDDSLYYRNRSSTLTQKRLLAEALKDINIAIQKKPSQIDYYEVRGNLLMEMKDWEASRRDRLRVLKDKENVSYQYLHQYFSDSREFGKSLTLKDNLDRMDRLSIAEKSPYQLMERAFVYIDSVPAKENPLENVNYKLAVSTFDQAFLSAKSIPDYNTSNHIYRICRFATDEFFDKNDSVQGARYAATCIDELIKREVDNESLADIYNMRGLFNFSLGNLDKATEDYSSAIKYFEQGDFLKSTAAAYRRNRGLTYRTSGALEKALDDANMSIAMNNNDPEVFFLRSTILRDKGDMQLAIADINTAIEKASDAKSKEIYVNFLNELLKKAPKK